MISTFKLEGNNEAIETTNLLIPTMIDRKLKKNPKRFNVRCRDCGHKKLLMDLKFCPRCKEKTPNMIEVIESQNINTKEMER